MYIQIQEAAQQLGVTRQWVHKLINVGSITTREIAGRRFVVKDPRFRVLIERQAEKRQALIAKHALVSAK